MWLLLENCRARNQQHFNHMWQTLNERQPYKTMHDDRFLKLQLKLLPIFHVTQKYSDIVGS
jgi:hypothetical protein